jgi:hypothetical protein
MLDFTDAFPKKVNIDQYKPVIDGALKAANGADGVPRVVIESFDTAALATRAANAIRKHSKENNLELRVSCRENEKKILVYKAKPRTRKAKDAPAKTTAESSSPGKN